MSSSPLPRHISDTKSTDPDQHKCDPDCAKLHRFLQLENVDEDSVSLIELEQEAYGNGTFRILINPPVLQFRNVPHEDRHFCYRVNVSLLSRRNPQNIYIGHPFSQSVFDKDELVIKIASYCMFDVLCKLYCLETSQGKTKVTYLLPKKGLKKLQPNTPVLLKWKTAEVQSDEQEIQLRVLLFTLEDKPQSGMIIHQYSVIHRRQ